MQTDSNVAHFVRVLEIDLFGTVQMGIFYTGVNTDWFKVFLGVMMLVAVLFNSYIRRKVTEAR